MNKKVYYFCNSNSSSLNIFGSNNMLSDDMIFDRESSVPAKNEIWGYDLLNGVALYREWLCIYVFANRSSSYLT